PRAAARFWLTSASNASTVRPSAARCRANSAARVVLPAPPFPTNAIFINGAFPPSSYTNGFNILFLINYCQCTAWHVTRLTGVSTPTKRLVSERADPLLEQLRGLQANRLTFDPTPRRSGHHHRVPHATKVPNTTTAKPDNSVLIVVIFVDSSCCIDACHGR